MNRLLRFCSLLLVGVAMSLPAVAQEVAGPSVEYEGALPPLVDRQTFFGDPQYANAQISPNGEFVSFTRPYEGQMNVWVKERGEPFDAAEPVTADTARPVRGYFWTQDSERILYIQDKGGDENFRIYAVDPDADEETELGVPPADDLTPYEDVRAQIIAVPESIPSEIVVGLNDRDPQYHDVYRLDLETGERTLVYKNDEDVAGWETDLEGNLRLATRQTDDGGTEILRVEEDTLVSVYSCAFEEECNPLRFHRDGERVYMETNKGDDVDLTRLVLFDPETQDTEVVASDPEDEVDFGGAIFSDATDELLATVYTGDRQRVYPKDEEFEADYQFLQDELDGEVSFGSSTEDEEFRVVTASSDVDPGSVYLFNREEHSLEKLYESRPELPSEHLSEMQAIRYEARDGLEIPAYLTLPKGVEDRSLPVVVFPHGGPWARDTWGYSSYAQFFANRGYAVLQPNFRGSTGYGQEFLNAGNKEWGEKMQDDLTDGVRHLIDEGIAHPERVGITGISYGGYATLAGLTFTPEVYAAGASYVGPSNLITLLNSIPPYWAPIKKMFTKRMGDPEDPEDKERLKEQSPFFHAENIDDPLLVIQGANDPRVKKQESDQIVVAARENRVPVQYLVAPEEGHGFAKENNRLAVAAQLERFFAEHLGGRYQTDVSSEVQSRLDTLRRDVNDVTLPDTTDEMASSDAPHAMDVADAARLESVTLEYENELSLGERSMTQSATRTVSEGTHSGSPVWHLVERGQRGNTDTVVVDRATLHPLQRRARGQARVDLTFDEQSVSGTVQMRGQSTPIEESFDQPVFASNAHMELALTALPLEEGYAASLPIYDLQRQQVTKMTVTVNGTDTVDGPDGPVETFVLDVQSDAQGPSGTMHVRTAAPHYVVQARLEVPSPQGTVSVDRTLTSISVDGV